MVLSMTVEEGKKMIQDLILVIGGEEDNVAQALYEELVNYALEARDVRQMMIEDDAEVVTPTLAVPESRCKILKWTLPVRPILH